MEYEKLLGKCSDLEAQCQARSVGSKDGLFLDQSVFFGLLYELVEKVEELETDIEQLYINLRNRGAL